jgi:hypothetical protein
MHLVNDEMNSCIAVYVDAETGRAVDEDDLVKGYLGRRVCHDGGAHQLESVRNEAVKA